MGSTLVRVDPKACIRCAACATVAPAHFSVRAGPAKVLRDPSSEKERRSCTAAALLCPTQAITVEANAAAVDPPALDPQTALYPSVMDIAEGVRWKVSDLPWAQFQPEAATAPFRALVHEMAYSEQTTFSATQRFMEAFGADADFSQWISVWFYEETRHPLVLLKWLGLAGVNVDDAFVQKGRESQPFMPSLTGTLVINIISEMVASAAYLHMTQGAPEPVLRAIATRLSADEARHGASFFTFARRGLEQSANADRERLDALKVLHFWLNIGQNVSHPVNEAMVRLKPLLEAAGAPPFTPPFDRVAKVVGLLTDIPLETAADLPGLMLEHTRRVRAQPRPS